MKKKREGQSAKNNSPAETRNDSAAPSDPKGQRQKQPQEGSVRKVEKRSDDPARFDDDYEAAQENAISEDEMRSEDENNS